MSVVCVTTRSHVDVVVCAAPETMLVSMDCVSTSGLLDPSGPCYSQRPRRCPQSRMPSRALSGSVVLPHPEAMFVVYGVTRKPVEAHDPHSC